MGLTDIAAGTAGVAPPLVHLALALGLSLFFGFAFEEFYARDLPIRPGGIRTFPLLALAGAALFDVEPRHATAFTVGLLVVGAWTFAYYRSVRQQHEAGPPAEGELIVPACNLLAYALGALTATQPPWVGIAIAVAAVLLITGRERLHRLATSAARHEVATVAQFLILVGVILPIAGDAPVAAFSSITPRQVWLAVVAVSTLSYAGYLVQRYVTPRHGGLLTAALGGLYSSTATTIVLARRSATDASGSVTPGIVLATAMMYMRLIALVAVFDLTLAAALGPSLAGLFVLGLILAFLSRGRGLAAAAPADPGVTGNPLQLGTALTFALLFVAVSLASGWAEQRYGTGGLYGLAAFVGLTDIDPYVLSVAQGGAAHFGTSVASAGVLLAASSNNIVKAAYALVFGGRRCGPAAGLLGALAIVGGVLAWLTATRTI